MSDDITLRITLSDPGCEHPYSAHCPEYDVISQGRTVAEAAANLREAVELVCDHGLSSESERHWCRHAVS